MRIYSNGMEVVSETVREVFSRGEIVFDKTVQGKVVKKDEGYEQREILNYSYKLLDLSDSSLDQGCKEARQIFDKSYISLTTATKWFVDFFSDENPDSWWKDSPYLTKYWENFGIEKNGRMSYCYGLRVKDQIPLVIKKLKANQQARGAVISVWDRNDMQLSLESRRVPCTLDYQFLIRDDELSMVISQRSCDLVHFFTLDFCKAALLGRYIAKEVGVNMGYLVHNLCSLHAYRKDVPERYKF